MLDQSSSSGPAIAESLDVHVAAFVAELARAGYAEKTLRDKRRLIKPFIRWTYDEHIAARDLDESAVDAFLACPSRRRYKHRTTLQQFVESLRNTGVVPRRRLELSLGELLLERYFDHLRSRQGLSPNSLCAYSPFVRSFVAAQRLPENAETMDALEVRLHLIDGCRDRSVSSVKLHAAALRSFLRFCFLDGTIARDLSGAVPPVGRWQATALPRVLTGEEVEQVIVAADRSTCPIPRKSPTVVPC
jgi:integrase/recombinase XerD